MSKLILTKIDNRKELVCEHCGEHFYYIEKRHCWKCDTITCPRCSTAENVCAECKEKVLPENIEPMLAKTGRLPRDAENWAYEFKWDGIRALTYWNGHRLRIESRNLANITFRYPELAYLGKSLGASAIVDGEIIALDENNVPSFSILQQRMHISASKAKWSLPKMRIRYYIFDLLFLNGRNFLNFPYRQRRAALENLNLSHPLCSVPPKYLGSARTMLRVAQKHHLEGILCKKLDSLYLPGIRSDEWIKVKLINSREFIIGGFKYAQGSANRIGSLQLGAYNDDMILCFVGSTGTGFSRHDHELLLNILEPVKTAASPFGEKVDKDVHFTRPLYVAEVSYSRWPKGGHLQQCVYKALRPDKTPSEIKLKEL